MGRHWGRLAVLLLPLAACAEPPTGRIVGGPDSATTGSEAPQSETSNTPGDTDPASPDHDDGPAATSSSTGGGLDESGGVDTDGAPTDDGGSTGPGLPAAAATVYVNFDGVELSPSTADDATANESALLTQPRMYEPADPSRAPEILAGLQKAFSAFDVNVTDERPPEGAYTMLVVTSSLAPQWGVLSVGIADCGDSNPNNVGLIYDEPDAYSITQVVNAGAQQLATGFGLSPVTAATDLMHEYVLDKGLSFTDECLPLTEFAPCDPLADPCGPGMQSSVAELQDRFGG